MKITRRQLKKIIQEAMYYPKGRRDASIAKHAGPLANKIIDMMDGADSTPEMADQAYELLYGLEDNETGKLKNPHPEFPEAETYREEISQFDSKMILQHLQLRGLDKYELALTKEDKRLRKDVVDYVFDPNGAYQTPISSLSGYGPDYMPGGLFSMRFMLWSEIIPEEYWEDNSREPGFRSSVERVFNSMGGSYYQGDGDTLIPLKGLSRQDQLAFNQVILKVINNDPEFV